MYLNLNYDTNVSTWWVINEWGEEVEGTRDVGDGYKRNQNLPDGHPNKLPDPKLFSLGTLPAIESRPAATEESRDVEREDP